MMTAALGDKYVKYLSLFWQLELEWNQISKRQEPDICYIPNDNHLLRAQYH